MLSSDVKLARRSAQHSSRYSSLVTFEYQAACCVECLAIFTIFTYPLDLQQAALNALPASNQSSTIMKKIEMNV
jgi:hypothetical protein